MVRWFIVRGTIAPHGANYLLVGQFTFLARYGPGHFLWDGARRAHPFDTPEAARAATEAASGPWFRTPDPDTITIIEESASSPLDCRNTAPAPDEVPEGMSK